MIQKLKILSKNKKNIYFLKASSFFIADKIIEVSKSTDHSSRPIIPETVRADIILSGTIIENINKEEYTFKSEEFNKRTKFCKIKTYSEIDLKWALPAFVTKPFAVMEIKKFTEKCLGRMKEFESVDSYLF